MREMMKYDFVHVIEDIPIAMRSKCSDELSGGDEGFCCRYETCHLALLYFAETKHLKVS